MGSNPTLSARVLVIAPRCPRQHSGVRLVQLRRAFEGRPGNPGWPMTPLQGSPRVRLELLYLSSASNQVRIPPDRIVCNRDAVNLEEWPSGRWHLS